MFLRCLKPDRPEMHVASLNLGPVEALHLIKVSVRRKLSFFFAEGGDYRSKLVSGVRVDPLRKRSETNAKRPMSSRPTYFGSGTTVICS